MQYCLPLNIKNEVGHLKNLFEKASGKEISLAITDNCSRMLSIRAKDNIISVRLHRIFLEADLAVIKEVADFVKRRNIRTPLINSFIKERHGTIRKNSVREQKKITSGKYFDLAMIYDLLNSEYFNNSVSASITWGNKIPRRRVRVRILGSYSYITNTIRINTLLDSSRIPHYFIEYIIYHEMLHASTIMKKKNGRRLIHCGEFRELEKRFRDYEKATSWEKLHLYY